MLVPIQPTIYFEYIFLHVKCDWFSKAAIESWNITKLAQFVKKSVDPHGAISMLSLDAVSDGSFQKTTVNTLV